MQISDADSQYVRRSDCDTLFIVANYQPDKKDPAVAVNDEHALMRFEFLEAVVRLAVAKYGKVCLRNVTLHFSHSSSNSDVSPVAKSQNSSSVCCGSRSIEGNSNALCMTLPVPRLQV